MLFSRPLRAATSRYGARKQLSLDGTVKGVNYNRAVGVHASAPLPTAGQLHLYEEPLPDDYLPHAGPMQFDRPTYHQSEVLPGINTAASHQMLPPTHLDLPPDMIPESASYEQMLAVDNLINELQRDWQALHDHSFAEVQATDPTIEAVHEMFHADTVRQRCRLIMRVLKCSQECSSMRWRWRLGFRSQHSRNRTTCRPPKKFLACRDLHQPVSRANRCRWKPSSSNSICRSPLPISWNQIRARSWKICTISRCNS